MTTTFAVLGDGAWGTAISLLLAQNPHHRVTLWSAVEANGLLLQHHRENVRLLPGVPVPESIRLTLDIAEAVDGADLWIAAIPTIYLRDTLYRIRAAVPHGRAARQPGQGRREYHLSPDPARSLLLSSASSAWPSSVARATPRKWPAANRLPWS